MDAPTRDSSRRRMPVGAELVEGGADFRVWAPAAHAVELVLEPSPGKQASAARVALRAEGNGYHTACVLELRAGLRYRFSLDGSPPLPDPASRFQPQGPHAASELIDPGHFTWSDGGWRGPTGPQVLYELHLGTFTRAGSFAAAMEELPHLAELGVTAIELMPLAEADGAFGWGYDGVNLFAPSHLYGRPDDCRRFVDRAHALGLSVIHDVVYNHLGPSGNYLARFAPAYFTRRHANEWGEALNFDGPDAGPVRELFLANAAYWIHEFHMDGLRLDATQSIFDTSPRHLLAELTAGVRQAAPGRRTLVIGENEPQQRRLLRSEADGGFGLDALWNDDFHHTAHVAATGQREAYFTDYLGSPQELLSASKHGFLFQGQHYRWQQKPRGSSTRGLSRNQLVAYLQNHDQVANSGRGLRLHQLTSPGTLRALTALLLLGPQTPMLFQGQEFAASAPFLYFADHQGELGRQVRQGRGDFLRQFPSLREATLDDPSARSTFERCVLDFTEREAHAEVLALHRALLALRREAKALTDPSADLDGAVLGERAFCLRGWLAGAPEHLLLVNLGADLELVPAPEPLLAPPDGARWRRRFSSEEPRFGGRGLTAFDVQTLVLPAESATLLSAEEVPS